MPPKRKKPLAALLELITRRAQPLTALLLASGLVWLLLLPLAERRVKMDEKSLMVGAAVPTLRWVQLFAAVCVRAQMERSHHGVPLQEFRQLFSCATFINAVP